MSNSKNSPAAEAGYSPVHVSPGWQTLYSEELGTLPLLPEHVVDGIRPSMQ
ncbi:hypothetical protein [Onishia niordana]|uniref:hypothetical protein n=1 Tax=Onishia niordana TaxID=2508711 RepID=UPI001446F231|nr:hypothetical protein [Halomonas niordiana]